MRTDRLVELLRSAQLTIMLLGDPRSRDIEEIRRLLNGGVDEGAEKERRHQIGEVADSLKEAQGILHSFDHGADGADTEWVGAPNKMALCSFVALADQLEDALDAVRTGRPENAMNCISKNYFLDWGWLHAVPDLRAVELAEEPTPRLSQLVRCIADLAGSSDSDGIRAIIWLADRAEQELAAVAEPGLRCECAEFIVRARREYARLRERLRRDHERSILDDGIAPDRSADARRAHDAVCQGADGLAARIEAAELATTSTKAEPTTRDPRPAKRPRAWKRTIESLIADILTKNPGMTVAETAKRVGCANGTVAQSESWAKYGNRKLPTPKAVSFSGKMQAVTRAEALENLIEQQQRDAARHRVHQRP